MIKGDSIPLLKHYLWDLDFVYHFFSIKKGYAVSLRHIPCKYSISRVLFCFRSDDYLSRPAIADRLKRHNPEGRRATLSPSLFGLAPDGVYRANTLLHCWCALTAPFHPYHRSGGLLFYGTIP